MNLQEIAIFAAGVKLIDAGDYEGLPVAGTDRAGLAECAKIKAVIGDGPFTANHLTAYDAMVAATAPKPDKGQNGRGVEKLKWAAFPSDSETDSEGNKYNMPRLSDDAKELYTAFRQANIAAAKARAEFEEIALPEIRQALVKAAGKPLPSGKGVLVTYKFGRVNVAVADVDSTTSTSAKTLGDLY